MSGIESEWRSPESKRKGHLSGRLSVPSMARELLLPEEGVERFQGEHY